MIASLNSIFARRPGGRTPGSGVVEERRVTIPRDRIWSSQLAAGAMLRCERGVAWVTREGDQRDHVLEPGAAFRMDSPGQVCVISLNDATILLVA